MVERVAPGTSEALRADSIAETPHGLLSAVSQAPAGARWWSTCPARPVVAATATPCCGRRSGMPSSCWPARGRAATDRRRPARRHATGRARLPPLRSRERLGRCVARWMQLEGSRGGRAGCARWSSLPASCSARVHASAATCRSDEAIPSPDPCNAGVAPRALNSTRAHRGERPRAQRHRGECRSARARLRRLRTGGDAKRLVRRCPVSPHGGSRYRHLPFPRGFLCPHAPREPLLGRRTTGRYAPSTSF